MTPPYLRRQRQRALARSLARYGMDQPIDWRRVGVLAGPALIWMGIGILIAEAIHFLIR